MEALLKELLSELRTQLIAEIRSQKHSLTGTLENSITYEVQAQGFEDYVGRLFAEDYGRYVDTGVPSNRIPFTPGSGAQSSKYIAGLIAYWKARGLADKDALRASFALANIHKKEGIPNSYSLKIANPRTGFLTNTIENKIPDITARLDKAASIYVENLYTEIIKQIK